MTSKKCTSKFLAPNEFYAKYLPENVKEEESAAQVSRPRKTLETTDIRKLNFKAGGHMIFVGKTGSGKTTLLREYLRLNGKKYKKIIAFAGSKEFNTDYDFLPPNSVLDPTDMDKLSNIIKLCKQIKAGGKKSYNVLLIFDDIVGLINTHSGKYKKFFENLSATSRHYNVSICFLVQRLTAISPLIRDNCSLFFICKVNKESILDGLYSYQDDYQDKWHLLRDYSEHMKSKYASMLVQSVDPNQKNVIFLDPV